MVDDRRDLTTRRLRALAYRMLGRVADAEDIVQEAYLRFHAASVSDVQSEEAYLVRIVMRLCLNALRARKRTPIDYVGFDLPEPMFTGDRHDEADLAFGLLVVLQTLSPKERAVYLLRSGFDVPFVEIAAIVGAGEVACRKLFSRAAKHIAAAGPRTRPVQDGERKLLARLIDAVRSHDEDTVSSLLAEDIVLLTNAPKGRPALSQPLIGSRAVARFAVASLNLIPDDVGVLLVEANGLPAAVLRDPTTGAPLLGLLLQVDDGKIARLFAISDARKLSSLLGATTGCAS
jgi:RNA polymerase sigma-70 factor (ECF subfamily)